MRQENQIAEQTNVKLLELPLQTLQLLGDSLLLLDESFVGCTVWKFAFQVCNLVRSDTLGRLRK